MGSQQDSARQAYLSGTSHSSSSMRTWRSFGFCPSTEQPMENAVPSISLTVPLNSLAWDFSRIMRATSNKRSLEMFPECLMFLVFLRSRTGSFNSLIKREDALGSIETLAARFWMVNLTVIRIPFQPPEFLMMSSPIFLGDIPRGPILGAKTEDGAASPPYWRTYTYVTALGSNLGAMLMQLSLKP